MPFGPLPFASLVVESPPLQVANWYEYLETFLQDGGGFALLGLWIGLLWPFVRALSEGGRSAKIRITSAIMVLAVIAVVSTGLYAAGFIVSAIKDVQGPAISASAPALNLYDNADRGRWWNHLFTAGGTLAILAVLVPFARDLFQMRFRRIWAIVILSFKEAVRRRVLLVFGVLLLLFLFPPKWWDPTIKAEDEISTNINLIYYGATPLLILAAALLTSFAIPTDIRNQTIHTVVTKPVEKFEIVIGRFLGYFGLVSLILFGFIALSLGMIYASRVSEESREESMKARVPVYGDLEFRRGTEKVKGESVGREWEYRSYIPGGRNSPSRAVWMFRERDLDPSLASLPAVSCEFEFDIFRTTKGEENRGVFCTFYVVTHQSRNIIAAAAKAFDERTTGLSKRARPDPTASDLEREDWKKIDRIAGELGYYEYRGKEVVDYHTQSIPIPSSLFGKAMADKPDPVEVAGIGMRDGPMLFLLVRCDSPTQFLGVARNDLYLLAKEKSFAVNFFKGAMGLWLRLMLVIGVAIACSTYLNGVVTFAVVIFLLMLGFGRWFIMLLAMVPFGGDTQNNPGPADSLRKLISNESLGASPDAANATVKVTQAMDSGFRWVMRRLLNLVPNLERLSWTEYVAKGFNIPVGELGLNFLGVCAYLFLWAVLGHYVFKGREIATW